MGRIADVTRRTFLFGSVALAGGVAFGVYKVQETPDNPLAQGLAPDAASFNPWVLIRPDGITLIAPHTDVGQGARSVQALMIAEEMDLEPGQFTVEPGQPSPAYWNTAMAADAVPFLHTDQGLAARSARTAIGAVIKLSGQQVTGGSSTVADSWEKLRRAGAVARETLKQAAAIDTGEALDTLSTEAGAVVLRDGRRIPYTQLAATAARIDPVNTVTLRPPSAWRLLGKPVQRLDTVAKSTGTQTFGIDLMPEGVINATVRFNPRQGGALLSYDAADALSMPGVRQILPVTAGVAVLADNTWNAFQAASAIRCEWGQAPYPPEMAQHWAAVESSFTEERLDKVWREDGDVEATLASGAGIEREYRAPYLAHAPLEPLSALCRVSDGRADLWAAHQFPRLAQQLVADITGLPTGKVYLHNQYCGGSFGHRLEFENIRYATEIAVQLPGETIKLTFSREEDFAHDFPRQIGMARVRGVSDSGGIRALEIDVATPSAIASQSSRANLPLAGPDSQIAAGVWNAPYAIEHMRVRAYRVPELAPISSWRSVGASTGGFFIESAIDELLIEAGQDPLAGRLALCNDPASRRVLEAVREMSAWDEPLAPGRGRGVALVVSFGTPVAEVVEVSVREGKITIDKVFVAAEVGRVIDPVNFENQTAGGVIWGLGHAMNCEITYADGMAEQRNFHQHTGMRINQCPAIQVRGLESGEGVSGIGEPPVPPAAPALANAIYAATGQRLREMPFSKFVAFA
ncbi:xanthine dehydrogenase family protein molybdopterin-binding subunit [Parahaliea aestuarii]|uniref:Xanthine dehydrogenase family protein molybdopterin-binding subunit n=1 Tax=Parahaliea aestuarii TaxID=1852021 RepID=A0A5C8ZZU5_9GAMM|nr:molybdopterin cofactor-binding domain-containing protein [Parahaliea aestuarii]TXS93254.1 xanthine dehydrogenase family protein molybdopterin-binding subunit [Parahaliea aestuarii]